MRIALHGRKTESHLCGKLTIYIFEFKLDVSAKQALEQIRQKEYFMPYKLRNKKIIGVGIHLSSSLRNIKEWEEEEIWRN